MTVKGIAATHVQCNECGTREPIEDQPNAVCRSCEERGEDPTCVQLVAVVPCPDGVTGAMWATGLRSCNAEEHEHLSGQHVIEVE